MVNNPVWIGSSADYIDNELPKCYYQYVNISTLIIRLMSIVFIL